MVEATLCAWPTAEDGAQELLGCCPQDVGAGVPEHLQLQEGSSRTHTVSWNP